MKANACHTAVFILLAALFWPTDVLCHESKDHQRLSKIGPAPEFTLTQQDGKRLALNELRGKVLAITFIFASCTDTCPLLTAKMAGIQNRLGSDFGSKVYFVSITVDPERDTAEVLKRYAEAYKANLAGWAFSLAHRLRFAPSPSVMESTTKDAPYRR
jgi:protein SCO1/2